MVDTNIEILRFAQNDKVMKRRDFIKIAGAATVAVACGPRGSQSGSGTTEEQMEMRENPVSGDKVSLLGFGCMRWPMTDGPEEEKVIDQDAVNEMVDYALEHGINYFDTSPVYLRGQSEKAAGVALSRHPRSSYFLATKLSNFSDASAEVGKKMYARSFEQLKTDYFDYYLLHAMSGEEDFRKRYVENGLMDFLKEEKAAGRIRNLGFSFHGPKSGFDELIGLHDKGEYHWDFVQIQMNYVDWNHQDDKDETQASYMYAELEKRGIPVVIMEPLLGGQLANVPSEISKQMKARAPQKSVASWAFRFCGSYPGVLCILSGMSSMDPLLDNINTFGHFRVLSADEKDFLERMAVQMKEYPLVGCTGCQYCMPCPWGIDIPGIFRHYNRAVTEGTYAQSSGQKDYARLKKAYLVSYDRAVASVRQADHCIGCGECVKHCPQGIKIPGELRRIARYVEGLKQDLL